MAKSPSEDKIEKALGIGEQLANIENKNEDNDDLSKKKRFEQRQKLAKELQGKLNKVKESSDDDFIKQTLRDAMEVGTQTLRILQDEVSMTGDYKNAEALGSVLNSVVSAAKELKEVYNDKEKMQLEKDKFTLRSNAVANLNGGGNTTNVIFAGSTADLLKAINNPPKTIDAEKIE